MVSVTPSMVRNIIGELASSEPSDEVITEHIGYAERYVAFKIDKATLDYTDCTDAEASAIAYRAAYMVAVNLSSKVALYGTVRIGDLSVGDRILATRELVRNLYNLSEEQIRSLGKHRALEFTDTVYD